MRSLLLVVVLVLAAPLAPRALTLAHGDLVAAGRGEAGAGLYRIDGVTGVQELIVAGDVGDFALRGAHRIYASRGDAVVEIDPTSGSERVVASGFSGSVGVTVNRSGDVFVYEDEFGGPKRMHRVDPATGATVLIATSTLTAPADTTRPGISFAIDLELLDEETPIVLAQGPAFGLSLSGGVVAYDRWSGAESILVSSQDVVGQPGPTGTPSFGWIEPTGLGVTPDGRVLVACDGDFDCGVWSYDPGLDDLQALGVEDLIGPGEFGSVDWNDVDIAGRDDGQLFISTFNKRAEIAADPALSGIHPLFEGACPFCPPGSDRAALLVDDEPFARGSWDEIQVVDAQTPIPEPSAFVVFAAGLVGVAAGARRRSASPAP